MPSLFDLSPDAFAIVLADLLGVQPANVYNHQRSASNPRAYTAGDVERREEYPNDAYPYYNNNTNYNYGAQPMR